VEGWAVTALVLGLVLYAQMILVGDTGGWGQYVRSIPLIVCPWLALKSLAWIPSLSSAVQSPDCHGVSSSVYPRSMPRWRRAYAVITRCGSGVSFHTPAGRLIQQRDFQRLVLPDVDHPQVGRDSGVAPVCAAAFIDCPSSRGACACRDLYVDDDLYEICA